MSRNHTSILRTSRRGCQVFFSEIHGSDHRFVCGTLCPGNIAGAAGPGRYLPMVKRLYTPTSQHPLPRTAWGSVSNRSCARGQQARGLRAPAVFQGEVSAVMGLARAIFAHVPRTFRAASQRRSLSSGQGTARCRGRRRHIRCRADSRRGGRVPVRSAGSPRNPLSGVSLVCSRPGHGSARLTYRVA